MSAGKVVNKLQVNEDALIKYIQDPMANDLIVPEPTISDLESTCSKSTRPITNACYAVPKIIRFPENAKTETKGVTNIERLSNKKKSASNLTPWSLSQVNRQIKAATVAIANEGTMIIYIVYLAVYLTLFFTYHMCKIKFSISLIYNVGLWIHIFFLIISLINASIIHFYLARLAKKRTTCYSCIAA